MAINIETYGKKWNASEDWVYELSVAASDLRNRLEKLRAQRLTLGLPFSGKLEQSFRELQQSLTTLGKDYLDFEGGDAEALKNALNSIDKLGPFLNLKVGPGGLTLRDQMTERKKAQENEILRKDQAAPSLEDSLQTLSDALEISTDRQAAPLYDYARENDPEPDFGPAEGQRRADLVLAEKLQALRQSGPQQDRVKLLAELFGARIAANAERNALKLLERTQIRPGQVEHYAKQLLDNPLFQKFAAEQEAELTRLSRKNGHGGVLETAFKKFLLNLPGGELRNDPVLARYMPSYKDRIEVLKKQVEHAPEIYRADNAVAEMVTLRGLAHADRHHSGSLEDPIATDPSNRLGNCSKILADQDDFRSCLDAVRESAVHGHGGQMVEDLRKAWERRKAAPGIGKETPSELTRQMLYKTTYRGRMDELRVKAALLREEILQGKPVDESVKLRYRELCLENFALSDQVNHKHIPSDTDVDEAEVRRKAEILGTHNDQFGLANTRLLRQQDVEGGLKAIIETKGVGYKIPKFFPMRVNARPVIQAEEQAEPDGLGLNAGGQG